MISVVPLLTAAALVGILHMAAPDHWVTIVILGRASNWTRRKLIGVALVAGGGHVVLSVLLGFAVIVIGIVFSSLVSRYFTLAIGILMLVGGLFYSARSLLKKRKETSLKDSSQPEEKMNKEQQPDRQNDLTSREKLFGKGASYFAVLGAALSPDLSILPIFLIAVPVGLFLAIDTALVFVLASLLTIILLVYMGSMGLGKVFERVPVKYNDALVGFIISAVGAYILFLV